MCFDPTATAATALSSDAIQQTQDDMLSVPHKLYVPSMYAATETQVHAHLC